MFNVNIKTIPHAQQRYDTCGDWWVNVDDQTIEIRVSAIGDWKKESLIALHELVEVILCEARGISVERVDTFDMNYLGEGEPGDNVDAPYHEEHKAATSFEKLLCTELGISWADHEMTIDDLNNYGSST